MSKNLTSKKKALETAIKSIETQMKTLKGRSDAARYDLSFGINAKNKLESLEEVRQELENMLKSETGN